MEDPDQYSTDFTKCLKYLNAHAAEIIASPRVPNGSVKANGSTSKDLYLRHPFYQRTHPWKL